MLNFSTTLVSITFHLLILAGVIVVSNSQFFEYEEKNNFTSVKLVSLSEYEAFRSTPPKSISQEITGLNAFEIKQTIELKVNLDSSKNQITQPTIYQKFQSGSSKEKTYYEAHKNNLNNFSYGMGYQIMSQISSDLEKSSDSEILGDKRARSIQFSGTSVESDSQEKFQKILSDSYFSTKNLDKKTFFRLSGQGQQVQVFVNEKSLIKNHKVRNSYAEENLQLVKTEFSNPFEPVEIKFSNFQLKEMNFNGTHMVKLSVQEQRVPTVLKEQSFLKNEAILTSDSEESVQTEETWFLTSFEHDQESITDFHTALKNKFRVSSESLEMTKQKSETILAKTLTKSDYVSTPKSLNETSNLSGWGEVIEQMVLSNLVYPKRAQLRSISGKVFLKLEVKANGEILSVVVAKSSGFSLLDHAAKSAVSRTKRLPPAPENLTKEKYVFNLPINFRV